ncbi:MAG: endonuclease [Eggerthellaceae bacterium]|nr:endonuclease [Eggerthellaceae bacterium]
MKRKTKKRAMAAIGRYLELKGYKILEEGWSHGGDTAGYIVTDGYGLAFVFGDAARNAGEGIPDRAADRKAFERLAAAYLTEHPEHADCPVRADVVALLVLSDNRAILRHHVNAIDACGLDLLP